MAKPKVLSVANQKGELAKAQRSITWGPVLRWRERKS